MRKFVLDIAAYIVEYSNKHRIGINNLRLNKLLYFIQAYSLMKSKGTNYLFDADIEAWDLGPIIPIVFHNYKRFGSGQIPFNDDSCAIKLSDEEQSTIEEVVDHFKEKDDIYLLKLVHNQTPWMDAYKNNDNKIITREKLYEYFS